jgi:hypothetical protein
MLTSRKIQGGKPINEKKFELTAESKINIFGKKLFRIKVLISFGDVEEGETGGWIEKEENLEQSSGDAWVYGDARVSGDADYTTIHGFGTQFRTTTFFQCEDKQIRVSCGCFLGTIPEFREQVKNTREGKIAEEYLMIADLMEKHFVKEKESGE